MKKLKTAQLFLALTAIAGTAMEAQPIYIATALVCACICFAAAEIVRAINGGDNA